ncbi:MAG: hypothetical protein DBX03_02565 [Puniceicoccaceae bacterium]|nr:MAG: hypothetical protein DBX03_02565 [Puniceicoccaceae bacterium]
MEIISVSFAIFVIQLSLVIVPVVFGVRLLTLSSEKREDLKVFLAKKLLGDEKLIQLDVFNLLLVIFAVTFILLGIVIALLLFL